MGQALQEFCVINRSPGLLVRINLISNWQEESLPGERPRTPQDLNLPDCKLASLVLAIVHRSQLPTVESGLEMHFCFNTLIAVCSLLQRAPCVMARPIVQAVACGLFCPSVAQCSKVLPPPEWLAAWCRNVLSAGRWTSTKPLLSYH